MRIPKAILPKSGAVGKGFPQMNFLFKFFILQFTFCILITLLLSLSVQGEERGIEDLQKNLKGNPDNPEAHFELGVLLAQKEEKEEALTHLEKAILLEPQNLPYGNEYRLTCIRFEAYERSIEFFESLVLKKDPPVNIVELRINLSLSYVDKMPYKWHGVVGQGKLSIKSIREFNKVLELDPKNWVGIYGRAMNHLYWPRALRHAPQSIADFKATIALQPGRHGKKD
jgi:tetratricopeptide (TPR) repeat protein